MKNLTIKEKVIRKIKETDNDELLGEFFKLLEIDSDNNDEIYTLNSSQVSAVEEAQQQIKSGEVFTNEQADKEADEWLSK